ncbi:MAG: restriction endonuclease subunit S [Methylotenera sp.]|nr:restriction endonuclease subunit S [Methylotenera sp.]MDD4925593.1 restriction endonuclease subunit S [Methylotenera sp.]
MKAGWEIKTLGEVYDVRDGTHDSPKYVESGYPLITSKNLKDKGLSFENVQYITEADYNKINARSAVHRGDVLFAMIGTIGNPTIVEVEPNFAIKNVALLKVPQVQNSSFLKYYLETEEVISKMVSEAKGTTQKFVGLGYLRNFPIKIPSLSEQQRIVAILNQVFKGIAKARANAEQNLQNARALFESHLQSVFTQRGEGWVETKLGAEIDLLVGFAFKSTHYTTSPDDVRLLRGDNIIQGHLRWEDVKMWPSNDASIYSQYSLREGDVVLAMDRPWVKAGLKHATISADDLPCLLVQRTACLRAKMNLENRFLVYILGSAAFTNHILGVQTGIGVPHISGQQIKDFQFSRPPINEQKHIAQSLDSLQIQMRSLEALYQRKIALLDELKKSLLQQAFAGEL